MEFSLISEAYALQIITENQKQGFGSLRDEETSQHGTRSSLRNSKLSKIFQILESFEKSINSKHTKTQQEPDSTTPSDSNSIFPSYLIKKL